jgi:hypothetical protein
MDQEADEGAHFFASINRQRAWGGDWANHPFNLRFDIKRLSSGRRSNQHLPLFGSIASQDQLASRFNLEF